MSKILIAEDDMTIAEIEKDYLEVNGFEVDVVLTEQLLWKLSRRANTTCFCWIS